MRRVFTFAAMWLIAASLHYGYSQGSIDITLDQAFEKVDEMFSNRDVDYYQAFPKDNREDDQWVFFVDADPMAMWEHECYLVKIPRVQYISMGEISAYSERLSSPPDEYIRKEYRVKQRMANDAPLFPFVEEEPNGIVSRATSEGFLGRGRTYAVIFAGYGTDTEGADQFWGDCSFIYQTLRKRYSIPKQNIYALISDGYKKVDLDNDGVADVKMAATWNDLIRALAEINSKINENDHLFVFISNHGMKKDDIVYIDTYMFSQIKLVDLNDWLSNFAKKNVNVSLVLGSCYSGAIQGFVEDDNMVVATCASENGSGYYNKNAYTTIFMHHWTSAVNGADFKGKKVNADVDGDGIISMREAYLYAEKKTKEDEKRQNPTYKSLPESHGDILAFDRLPKGRYDLYLRDYVGDVGNENSVGDVFWNSPDIWIRNTKDDKPEPENPYYSDYHYNAYVYTTVHNNSGCDYTGGKSLRLYWAQASTYISKDMWSGDVKNDWEQLGDIIGTIPLDYVPASGSKTVCMTWNLPLALFRSSTRPKDHQFCILGEIIEDGEESPVSISEILGNRNLAQYNFVPMYRENSIRSSTFFVSNNSEDVGNYTQLQLRFDSEDDKNVLKYANVIIDMSPELYNCWDRGLGRARMVKKSDYSPYALQFLNSESSINDILFNSEKCCRATIIFEFFDASDNLDLYNLDVIQKTRDGKVLGGQRISMFAPIPVDEPLLVLRNVRNDGAIEYVALVKDGTVVNWYNSANENIGRSSTLTVMPNMKNVEFRAVAISSDGELIKSSYFIENEVSMSSIRSSVSEDRYIAVDIDNVNNYHELAIKISSLLDGKTYITRNIPKELENVRIDISMLPSGLYVATYMSNGKVVENYKFNISK